MSTEKSSTEYVPPAQRSRSDGGASGSLICGVLGLLICPLALVAVILGHLSRGRIKRSNGALTGDGKARAGLIMGYIGMALGIIGGLMIVPTLNGVVNQAKTVEMKSNGKNTFIAVFADALDTEIVGFPAKGKYPSTSAYFKALGGDNPKGATVMMVSPDFFGGPHVQPATSWSTFSAANNGWRVVEGLSTSSDAEIPFLISSNVKADRLSDLKGRVGDAIDPNAKGIMKKKVVVAMTGGGSTIYDAKDTWPPMHHEDAKILPP